VAAKYLPALASHIATCERTPPKSKLTADQADPLPHDMMMESVGAPSTDPTWHTIQYMDNNPKFSLVKLLYTRNFLLGATAYCLISLNLIASGIPEIERLLETGEIYRTLKVAERELNRSPQDLFLLETAGRLRFQVGDYRIAEQHFKLLIDLSAQPSRVWVLLARHREEASLGDGCCCHGPRW